MTVAPSFTTGENFKWIFVSVHPKLVYLVTVTQPLLLLENFKWISVSVHPKPNPLTLISIHPKLNPIPKP